MLDRPLAGIKVMLHQYAAAIGKNLQYSGYVGLPIHASAAKRFHQTRS